jgi:hypothetical protein
MAIRIFDVDPDARPKKRFQDDIVGRFRSGAQVNGRPLALEEWRITTGDPAVAERVQDLYGGQDAQTWITQGEDNLEVYTTTSSVAILLDGPGAIRSGMALWGRNGLIHSCDGETTTDGQGRVRLRAVHPGLLPPGGRRGPRQVPLLLRLLEPRGGDCRRRGGPGEDRRPGPRHAHAGGRGVHDEGGRPPPLHEAGRHRHRPGVVA